MRPSCVAMSLAAFEEEARAFAGSLIPNTEGATLVTLSGDLGSGKTTFTQNLAGAFGVTEPVQSPTFVLAKTYALPEEVVFRTLVHIDAYRLTEGKDLVALDFARHIADAGTLIMLEWPEMVEDGLPPPAVRITLASLPDGSRTITYA